VDESEHARLGGYPQPFRKLLGIDVVDFQPLALDQTIDLRFEDGSQGRGSIWSEDIRLRGAAVVARSDDRPAITRHSFGKGTAFYLGTQPDANTMARLLDQACETAGVKATAVVPAGVEVTRRSGGGRNFLFVLNHRDAGVDVPVEEAGTNLLDGSSVNRGLLHLGPRGVAVVREGW
jgi:beta-galactosidase